MGSWQGDDYREIPTDGDPTEFETVQRRAYIWEKIRELGHPSLLDKTEVAETLDISRRQVFYDIEAVSEFVEEEIAGANHVGENFTIFEKAKREALRRGDMEMAIEALKDEAEWLENRGAINKEADEVEVTWRDYIDKDDED